MDIAFGTLVAICGAIPLEGGLVGGLFLAGLAGSPLHCGPMCGGFVLGQVADRMAATPAARLCEWRRVGSAALLPYHLGRIVTYAVLGALAGLGGASLSSVPWLPPLLLLAAASLFAATAWRRWSGMRRSVPAGRPARPVTTQAAPRAGALMRFLTSGKMGATPPGSRRGLTLGLILGFLPCGYLYAALAASASTGSPWAAAAGMAAFGAGTIPALVAIGFAGQAAGQQWRAAIASVAPFILVANAALLVLLAIRGATV